WVSRALTVALVRLVRALERVTFCPNYMVTTAHLELGPRDFFSAHEFAQMAPLTGGDTYRRLLRQNSWVGAFLPNAFVPLVQTAQLLPEIGAGDCKRLLEDAGGGACGDLAEDWERRRKVRRLTARAEREGGIVAFTPDECRGHFGNRAAQVAAAYSDRLARYGVAPPAGFVE
ncbi:MAG: hypothetical protein NTZ05_10170, partial [Chloroflexi bacterium]|nr:hypothetical protein [Chloroflexota bacterium]